MKTNIFVKLFTLALFAILLSACTQDETAAPAQLEAYYSAWYSPNSWLGEAGDWYFDVTSADIDQDIVESGIILVYMSVPGDIYPNAVRPMPAYALGANWDYLIPDYGKIEFLCDSQTLPGTKDYYFRFVIIPSGTQLKSTNSTGITKAELMKMTYHDVCKKYNIPE